MINHFFYPFVYLPIYNFLVFLVSVVPGHDLGLAIILLTLSVKFVLWPLYHRSAIHQRKMRDLQPKLQALKEQYKDRETQAKKTMELHAEHGISVFGGILPLLVQFPVMICLFFAVRSGFPEIHTDVLYSFITAPTTVNVLFLGIFSLVGKSIVLPILAGVTQYGLSVFMPSPAPVVRKEGEKADFAADFAQSMSLNTRYLLPVMIAIFGFGFPAAVSLYYIVFNLVTIAQEYFANRSHVLATAATSSGVVS